MIKISRPSKTVTAAEGGNNPIINTPTENGSHNFSEEKSSDAQSDSTTTLDICSSKSVVKRNVWFEFVYGIEDSTIIANGDVTDDDLKENSSDCEKIQIIVTSWVESTILNSVTGIHLHSSGVLSEILNNTCSKLYRHKQANQGRKWRYYQKCRYNKYSVYFRSYCRRGW